MKYFKNKTVLVTGACGFIGSHIVDTLVKLDVRKIIAIDDLSAGSSIEYLEPYISSKVVEFYKIDIRNESGLTELMGSISFKIDMIIHLAAQPSVPISVNNPRLDFEINLLGSFNILELARKHQIKEFVFAASGGTVYGEAKLKPTPEDYKREPISNYGAAKAAFEMYLSSYSHLYGIKASSLRFGNVFGERSVHGVIHDLFYKLGKNQEELEILGDGTQTKSYLYIQDCVQGFLKVASRESNTFEAYNMSAKPPIDVNSIATHICKELDIQPIFNFTGGKRGWKGDVTKGELDCSKIEKLGWEQELSFQKALSSYLSWLKLKYNVFQ